MRLSSFSTILAAAAAFIVPVVVGGSGSPARYPLVRRNLTTELDGFLDELETAASCAANDIALAFFKAIAETGDDVFVAFLQVGCTILGIESPDVCEGLMANEGPMIAWALRAMLIPSNTAQTFGYGLLGLCEYPAIEPYTVSFPKPKPDTTRPPPSGESPIQVVHISDIHVDLEYVVGSSYECDELLCCRVFNPSDAPGVTDYPAGPYGNVNCDSPAALEQSMYDAIAAMFPNASFTLFTGDIVEGQEQATTSTEVVNDINNAYSRMAASLGLVYGAVGNHDSQPVNAFPPNGTIQNELLDATSSISDAYQYIFNTFAADWTLWIGTTAAQGARQQYGSYSVQHGTTSLRIISINTQLWMKENYYLYATTMPRDPGGQLAWLVSELQAAEDAGQRVYIIGHMPPGRTDALPDYSSYLDQVIQRYEATIAALFWGHVHKDLFELSYVDYADPTAATAVAMHYIAPALTPTSGNPTFRVYSVDPVTFGILDYTVYYANLTSPTYQTSPTWTSLYSAKAAYGSLLSPPVTAASAELTPAFWHNVTTLLAANETVFAQWYARQTRDYGNATCDASCAASEICMLRSAQSQYNCDETVAQQDTCSGGRAGPVLSALAANTTAARQAVGEAGVGNSTTA